jgi:hypothetical protein
VSFRAWDRVVYLLAVGFVSSICVQSAPSANGARSPSGEWVESSAQQSVSEFDLQNKSATAATVEDVQRILAEDKSKPDAEVARQLSGLELTRRMSSAKLKSLQQSAPGTKSRRALLALADASVFLSPAAADLPSQARPDVNEQRRMLALTVGYLAKTLPRLPNFYATRTTLRCDDGRRRKRARAGSQDDASWRKVGSSKVVVVYRDGKEVIDPREWGKHPHHPEGEGLITRGTFGPILSVVFVDAAHSGGFTWSRWERGSAGTTVAVFRYRVPKEQSHYSVGFHGLSSDKGDAAQVTGYHGEVAIDPATGTMLRVTVQAEQSLGSPVLRSDIMVEYGPVEIGGKTYTCPVRSVSISMSDMRSMGGTAVLESDPIPGVTLLNDVTFDNYHQFRSDSRILIGNIPVPTQ